MEKSKPQVTKKHKKTKSSDKQEHNYFKGHTCFVPLGNQSKYDINCSLIVKCILYFTTIRSGDIRARHMFRSYAALCAERYRHYSYYPFSIHPFSMLRIAIESLSICIFLVCNTIIAVYATSADSNQEFELIVWTCEWLYIINIVANFFTGYVEGNTSPYVVLTLKDIILRYIRTWLATDLVFSSGLVFYHFRETYIWIRTIALLGKILKLPALFSYTYNVMEVLQVKTATKTITESMLLIYSFLTWIILFQFYEEYFMENDFYPKNPRACSWMTITGLWNSTMSERLILATNRAVGLLRQNSNLNLLYEGGCFEYFFIISWIVAKLIVTHCILKYMILLFGLESARAKYFIMARQVRTYVNQRKFPERLKKKIMKFYAVRFQSHFYVESRMLACMSGQLREDILMHSGRQLVNQIEFLKNLPRGLLLQIGSKLKVVIFLAGDIIYKINTIGDCLYFIDKGTVAIYSESGKEICHLNDGDFFGENALIMKRRFRTASAVAVTNCELFRLDKIDFETTIACYPTVYESILKVATHRVERTTVMDEHYKAERYKRDVRQEEDENI